ncbi:MAG: hypothetical protein AAB270_00410 [Chloroflexota bacterium]
MRNRTLYEKLYIGGGALALGGVALVLSVLFAGAGVMMLFLALLTLLAGLVVELLWPQPQRSQQPLESAVPQARGGREG